MNIMMDSSDELRIAERSFSSRLLIGTGKYKDKLGAFICELDNGKRFQMSGMTDSVRENYMTTHPVGTIVTYTYMGLTGDGIPRHPGYLRKRESRE